jgi:Cu/Ag efflux pump CusA
MNKLKFLSIPFFFLIVGLLMYANIAKSFTPKLNEGSFLMPTSTAHAIFENKKILQIELDMAT